jgi:hypothetical protein
MPLKYAEDLEHIYGAFNNHPIAKEDLEAFYQEASTVRGKNPKSRMARLLRNNPDRNEHILFAGYKGCGKSTELNYLDKELTDEFLVLNISIHDELDPVNLEYIELFIIMMERLFVAAVEDKLKISTEYLKSVQLWATSTEINRVSEKYNLSGGLDMGGELSTSMFAKFFGKFRLTAKTSKQFKQVLKTEIEPRLSDLIRHCNDLVAEIQIQLAKKSGKRDLLIILEDLDKIPPDRSYDLFYNYVSQLTQIRTNVIYTFPAALFYSNTRYNQIRSHFTQVYELPMIKVLERNGQVSEEGLQLMQEVIKARMDAERLFADPELLNKMIRYSGGVLRDLFLMIQEAADNALDFGRDTIEEADWQAAFNSLKRDYNSNIADFRDGDKLYEAETYLDMLTQLAQSEDKLVLNTEEAMHLRSNLCILAYNNGSDWTDVHPIVRALLRDRNLLV